VAGGVPYGDLKPQAADAVEACENAVQQNPRELRYQYQLARALELAGDGPVRTKNRQRAFEIHQTLVRAGYVAAFDNLASIYWWDRKDTANAVGLWRKGVDLGDTDSMISLAELIEKGRVVPQNAGETPLELYKRAADLGNENGARAYQAEVSNAEQQQQQQIQQLEQQRMMLQIIGGVLQNIRR
jgi:TPR repeat protein